MEHRTPLDETICAVLQLKHVAVVGLSDREWRDSHRVARYLAENGYTIVPINPEIRQVLGLAAYPDLGSAPGPIEVVNVFRRVEHVAGIVEDAIRIGARAVWTQYGLVDRAAAARAEAAGLKVVMDKCIMVEHSRHRGN